MRPRELFIRFPTLSVVLKWHCCYVISESYSYSPIFRITFPQTSHFTQAKMASISSFYFVGVYISSFCFISCYPNHRLLLSYVSHGALLNYIPIMYLLSFSSFRKQYKCARIIIYCLSSLFSRLHLTSFLTWCALLSSYLLNNVELTSIIGFIKFEYISGFLLCFKLYNAALFNQFRINNNLVFYLVLLGFTKEGINVSNLCCLVIGS
jgi:hypothetical protein